MFAVAIGDFDEGTGQWWTGGSWSFKLLAEFTFDSQDDAEAELANVKAQRADWSEAYVADLRSEFL